MGNSEHSKNMHIVRKKWRALNPGADEYGIGIEHMARAVLKSERTAVAENASRKALVAVAAGSKHIPRTAKRTGARRGSPPKDKFYASWEWKRARYEALAIHGHRCQCCGWQPGDTAHGHLVVDHVKPRRKFPELELDVGNLQVLCNDCNMGKGSAFSDDFREVDNWLRAIGSE